MDTVKYAFVGLAIIAVAFAAFVVMGGGAHSTDGSASPAYGAQYPQGGAGAQAAGGAPGGSAAGTAGGQAATATQEVSLTATSSGYDKSEIRVKAGVPVHFTFTANNAGCCAQLIIDKVGVQLVSRNGQAVDATFTPPSPGNYPYHCGMNMCRGTLVVE